MPAMSRVIVLCPLGVEAAAARSALGGRAAVVVSGPGARVSDAVRRAAADSPALVILAGLCGGLSPTAPAPMIGAVLSMTGKRWIAPVIPPRSSADAGPTSRAGGSAAANPFVQQSRPRRLYDPPALDLPADGRVTVLGVDHVVPTPRAKQALGERTGAELVDMESHHFAAACERLGIRWAIVRGVSDGPDDALPPGVERFVGPDGATRPAAVAAACLRRPWLLPGLLRLRGASARALAAMSERLVSLVDEQLRAGVSAGAEPPNAGVA